MTPFRSVRQASTPPFQCCQPQRQAIELEASDVRVEAERSALDLAVFVSGCAVDQRAEAHRQFFAAERLGQKIVSPGP